MPTPPLRRAVGLLVLGFALLGPAPTAIAGGKGDRSAPAPRPWEDGSTQDQRDRAHAIFSDGNDQFFKRDYPKAIELYDQALAVFDHPRIRLALARTMARVGRPADAHPHVVAALRWGAAPLDAEEHAEALDLEAALEQQLAVIVIRCPAGTAQLTLDGKDIAPCPGDQRLVVMPGRHQVVAKQPAYLTFTEETIANAGEETALDVELKTLEAAMTRRRWATWKPWAVVGGGAALALVGLPLQYLASQNMDDYRDQVADLCDAAGCAVGTPEYDAARAAESIESRARLQNRIAISLWVVGGAVVTSGLVMVILNREHVVLPRTETVVVTPVVSPDLVGLGVTGGF